MIDVPVDARVGHFENLLFGCCFDCGMCCRVLCCPPAACAEFWAWSRGDACPPLHLLAMPSPIWIRANVRQARAAGPAVFSDSCAYCMCPLCALIQDGREIVQMRAMIARLQQGAGAPASARRPAPPPPAYAALPHYAAPPPPGYGAPPGPGGTGEPEYVHVPPPI
jgi:hypothetical protein